MVFVPPLIHVLSARPFSWSFESRLVRALAALLLALMVTAAG